MTGGVGVLWNVEARGHRKGYGRAWAAHLGCTAAVCGDGAVKRIWGRLSNPPPPFVQSREYGFIMGGSGNLLGAHLVYILCIAGWVGVIMTPFFLLLKRVGLMRVPAGGPSEACVVVPH